MTIARKVVESRRIGRLTSVGYALTWISVLSFAACNSDSADKQGTASNTMDGGAGTGAPQETGGGGTVASGGGAAVDGNSGGTDSAIGGGPSIDLDSNSAGTSPNGPDDACAAEDTPAMPVPLDIYLMLDISGSMLDRTTEGVSKWDAIKSAITSFLQNSGSADMSVGIQYFPQRKPGVPKTCTSNEECGAGGKCTLRRCTKYGTLVPDGIAVCETDADCAAIPTAADYGQCTQNQCAADATISCATDDDCRVPVSFDYGPCAEIGYCEFAPTVACAPNTPCGQGDDGEDRGNCIAATASYCFHGIQCDQNAYATPAVEISAMPDAMSTLVASLDAQMPEGDTPSAPALRGAIQHVADWANAHPQHTVVAVLATDGLPTECLPDDVPFSGTRTDEELLTEVEAIALAGTPGVSTFVIGVFGSDDAQAPANLERIAQAGGTAPAQIVDTAGDVTMQFLQALDAVRASQLQCEFQIPNPSSGETLDYRMVNVIYTEDDVDTALLYVEIPGQCDPVQGGWYYDDKDLIAPTKIVVCPTTCDTFKSSAGSVKIELGCETKVL